MLRALKYINCMSQLSSGKVEKVSGIFPHLDGHIAHGIASGRKLPRLDVGADSDPALF